MPSFRSIHRALSATATAMKQDTTLDPSGAARQVILGDRDAVHDDSQSPRMALLDEVESAIECRDADNNDYDPGNGIQDIPRGDAIRAAKEEAARFRSIANRQRQRGW
ncbi:hypothetical protein [Streptomyces mayteni]